MYALMMLSVMVVTDVQVDAEKPKPVVEIPSSLKEVNKLRVARGLHPFVLDTTLQKKANQRIRMVRGYTHHPGGSFSPARYEGVGGGKRFNTCFLYHNFRAGTKAGAASRNSGNARLHMLLIR